MKNLLPENSFSKTKSCWFNARSLLLICLLMILSLTSRAQNPTLEWTKMYSGLTEDGKIATISSWLETSDGYLIGGSSMQGIGNQKSEPSRGGDDFWIIKTDKAGNKIWDKTFGGSGTESLKEIIGHSDGGFLLAGTTNSAVSGDKTAASKGGVDFWVIKISPTGTKQWDRTYGGSSDDLLASGVRTFDDGYLLAGTSNSNAGGDKSENTRKVYDEIGDEYNTQDYWVINISPTGTKIWDKTYGGGGPIYHDCGTEILQSIIATTDGGYLLGGYSSSYAGYEKTSNSIDFPYDFNYWVIKVNSLGVPQWDYDFGGWGFDYLRDLLLTPDGGFILAGQSHSDISGNKTVEPERNQDQGIPNHIYLIKLSENGTRLWEKTVEPSRDPNNPYNFEFDFISLSKGSDGFYLFTEGVYELNTPKHILKFDWNGNSQFVFFINNDHQLRAGFFGVSNSDELLVGLSGKLASEGQKQGYIVSKYKPASGTSQAKVDVTFPSLVNFGEPVAITSIPFNLSSISKIEFYSNGQKIGEDTTDPYGFAWEKAPAGVHHIYAKATNTAGNTFTSFTLPLTVFANSAVLKRAINLNGGSTTIDRIPYETSKGALNFTYTAKAYVNQAIALNPATDNAHATLIRSSLYGTATAPATFTIGNLENGSYEVYMYVWEDNVSSKYSIAVEGKTVLANYNSGSKGNWKKIGPFAANISDRNIQIKTSEGDANISSIEIWKTHKKFARAINVAGRESSLIIDGRDFKGDWIDFEVISGKRYENQNIVLSPATDVNRAKMIRSSIYSTSETSAILMATNLAESWYEVFIYVWEDNSPSSYTLKINSDPVLVNYNSGSKGSWKKLGPFRMYAYNSIHFMAEGGDANISGIEIWKIDPVTIPGASGSPTARIAPEVSDKGSATSVSVFPNPFNDRLSISTPSAENEKVDATLMDQYGQVQFKVRNQLEDNESLELVLPADLASGVYFLKVKMGIKEKVFRILKE